MSSKSYEKGRRAENEIVQICLRNKIEAKRTPMSKKPDVVINGRPVEVKIRRKLPEWLTGWLDEHDYMLVREAHGPWLKISKWSLNDQKKNST